MSREEYLSELHLRLSHRLGEPELSNTMRYYEEYFDEAGPAGEARVIQELGSPEKLVRRIMGEQALEELDQPREEGRRSGIGVLWTVLLAICAAPVAIPLIIAAVAVAVALVIAVLAVVLSVGVAGLACLAVGAVVAFTGFTAILTHGIATTMYFVGGGLLAGGIGLLLIAGVVFLAGLCFKGIARLLGRIMRRGGR